MLSVFPQLLFLSPLSTTLIRVAVALTYIYVGYRVYRTAGAVTTVRFPVIGNPPRWLVAISALASGAIGCLLFFGAWTQVVAILATFGALKQAILPKWYRGLFPLSTTAALLLLVMSLSLIFSGAGAFALDWPL